MRDQIAQALDTEVISATSLRGGDVADAFRVELADGRIVFAKTHTSLMFTTEAAGLQWLHEANALPVPAVLAVSDDPPLLVLEWIDESRAQPDDVRFGRDLARLHQAGASTFGREDRRTTGSRGLPNEPCATWVEFFATQRLAPIARLIGEPFAHRLDDVATRLEHLAGPPEPAARLHGDLWAGNRIVDTTGTSWLIDPACFGGHREFDLAMMRLFGGFDGDAFRAYDEVFPLAHDWQARVPLHQLAPIAIHAIKFGGGYVSGLDRALSVLGA